MASDAVVEGISGAIGGCIATIATYPLMTVRRRHRLLFPARLSHKLKIPSTSVLFFRRSPLVKSPQSPQQ